MYNMYIYICIHMLHCIVKIYKHVIYHFQVEIWLRFKVTSQMDQDRGVETRFSNGADFIHMLGY